MRLQLLIILLLLVQSTFSQTTFPPEWEPHAGTWLQWPHDYTYGSGTRAYFEDAWISMTGELIKGEKVYIIAYNEAEQNHIETVLLASGINLDSVDFYIHPNNDYWVRDNGPVFVHNTDNELVITDWGFDGWGNDAPYDLCNDIPLLVGSDISALVIDVNEVVLEGGAVEHDGNGTFIGTVSSILGDGRNPGKTETDMEAYMAENLGFEQFIWLEGSYGGSFDITDSHVDGFLKFHDPSTIITMSESDLNYWYVNASDRDLIFNATNTDGEPYNYVILPLTDKNVKTTDGFSTGSKGSYVNYYVGNAVVLVPVYEDDNDSLALAILQDLMPEKEVIGIDCRNMYSWGGMVHCVTQQQPAGALATPVSIQNVNLHLLEVHPNPTSGILQIQSNVLRGQLQVLNLEGNVLIEHTIEGGYALLDVSSLPSGSYIISLVMDGQTIQKKIMRL